MISIGDALEAIIQNYPFIETGLSKGIINCSAYAREVKPQIEKRLYKDIKEGAIAMALKRIRERLSEKGFKENNINLTNLTVRSNLSEYTFLNSVTLAKQTSQLFSRIMNEKDSFCALSEGVKETTFVISSDLIGDFGKIFQKEALVAKFHNLSSVTIHLPKETAYTPGVYYQILKMIAWENINVIEVLSTLSELTIIFDNKDIDKAFSALKNLKTLSIQSSL